jgi:hypothetical protein
MENRHVAVTRAFSLLSDSTTGVISPQRWREFFVAYCDPNLGNIHVGDLEDIEYNVSRANEILKKLHDIDVDAESTGVNLEQFKKVTNVFFHKGIYVASKRPPQEFTFDVLKQLNYFFYNGYDMGNGRKITWDGSMDCFIAVATIVVFYQSWRFAHAWNTSGVFMDLKSLPTFWLMFVISLIYVFAISVKISSLGAERFWYKNAVQHRFDFFNVYGLIIIELLYLFVFPIPFMVRAIMLLHMARGFRLFYYIEPLQSFFSLMTRLVPIFWQMFMILFIIYWVFCDIGQLWFGGLMYTSNPNLDGTDYQSMQYFELNFNCFLDGMITLFTLMCMNNWSDTSDGYMQATQSYMSQAYFVCFTLICNMVVLNILIALILDCTGIVKEEEESEAIEGQGGGGVDVMAKLLGEDASSSAEESDSSSSSSAEDDEANEFAMEQSQHLSMVSQSRSVGFGHTQTSRKQKAGGQSKDNLAPTLTKAEKKRFEKQLGSPSSSSRKSRKSIC